MEVAGLRSSIRYRARVFGTATAAADGSFDVEGEVPAIYCNHQVHVAGALGDYFAWTALPDGCDDPDPDLDLVLLRE